MPANRAYGMDQEFYPWSPIVTRPVLRWPDGARVALRRGKGSQQLTARLWITMARY